MLIPQELQLSQYKAMNTKAYQLLSNRKNQEKE